MAAAPSVKARVLLVGTFPHQRTLEQALARRGLAVVEAPSASAALASAATERFEAIVASTPAGADSVAEPLARVAAMIPESELVLVTEGTPPAALDHAAFACVDRSAALGLIASIVLRAAETSHAARENAVLRELAAGPDEPELVGASEAMKRVASLVERLSAQDSPVVIEGEPGTEKETVARLIHARSARRTGPFVAVPVALTPPEVQAVLVFGQEKGSSRAALRERRGRLELAEGGSAFFDDITALGLEAQSSLVAFLKHGETRRVGSTRSRPANARLLAGASRAPAESGLDRAVIDGLGFLKVSVPPLRERKGDIAVIAASVLKRIAPDKTIAPDALGALEAYDWPGNVRELEIVLEYSSLAAGAGQIEAGHLPLARRSGNGSGADSTLAAAEMRHIRQVLADAGGNKSRAAEMLGITRRRLYHLLGRPETKA